ncbi:MAG: hypothetical protein HC880_07940 [Bacteroidia bacterium]|nr:hypothetical protein [Bacteroidia bacterium]
MHINKFYNNLNFLFYSTTFLINLLTFHSVAQSTSSYVGQKKKAFFNITEIGYSRGIGNFELTDQITLPNEGYVVRVRTIFGRFLNPHLSIGLGAGLDGIHNPGFNTLPIFIDSRYYFSDAPQTPFLFLDLGYSVKLLDTFEQGVFTNFGIGYKLTALNRLRLLFGLGYNIHQIRQREVTIFAVPGGIQSVKSTFSLQSLSLNLGLLFNLNNSILK